MTHSNHRRGDRESLTGDYVVFTTDARRHDPAKLKKYVEILMSHNPVGLATRRFELEKRIRKGQIPNEDIPYPILLDISPDMDINGCRIG